MADLEKTENFGRGAACRAAYFCEGVSDGCQVSEPVASACPFRERFLQVLWNEQYFLPEMFCEDGSSLRVLSPGTWNRGEGPDFTDATLLLNGRLVRGAVEIHRFAGDWFRHGHHKDPRYAGVVLHVVWRNDPGTLEFPMPVFAIPPYLQGDWQKLLEALENFSYAPFREIPVGECALRWAGADDTVLRHFLRCAGLARFSRKVLRLQQEAAEHGLEQALYCAIFEALGYQRNQAAFRALAALVPLERLKALPEDADRFAMLWGMAGLLPDLTKDPVLPEWRERVRDYWERWWRQGGEAALARSRWSFSALRPYNSPHRRLAAALFFLSAVDFAPAAWLRRVAETADCRILRRTLPPLFSAPAEWQGIRDFGHRLAVPAALIGGARLLDILANVLLPFLPLLGKNDMEREQLQKKGRALWMELPCGQENRLCREASLRFFCPPSRSRQLLRSYAEQQGLLTVYRDICRKMGNLCGECPLCREGLFPAGNLQKFLQ